MTSETAYAMRVSIGARILAIEAERAALEALELAYDNYLRAVGAPLEQPGSKSGGEPTLVSQPSAGETAGGDWKRPASTTPPAVSQLICNCGFVAKTIAGLGVHRSRSHPRAAATAALSEANGHPAHPSRSEQFLCGVCSRPFPTRIACDDHQAENACAAIPTRPPSGRVNDMGALSGPNTRSGGLGQ